MLLSLSMIVRDEEEQLPGCLASVQEAVDEIIVVDTGSTDRTVEIAEEFGARIVHCTWENDFAQARNAGLAVAKGRWVLVLDADERFEGDPQGLRDLLGRTTAVGFNVRIRNELGDGRLDLHSSLRLFRRLPSVHFERRLHEQVLPSLLAAAKRARIEPAPFTLRHLGYVPSLVARKRKRERNLQLAKGEADANPFDPFAAFNLGIEYTASGDLEAGVAQFRRARTLAGRPASWQSRLYKVEAQFLYQLGRHDEALEVIEEGLPAFPAFTDLYFLRAVTLQAKGEVAAAEEDLRHCLRLGPASSPPYDGVDPLFGGAGAATALGDLLRRLERYEESLALHRSAVLEAPQWMPAVQGLVEAVLASGEDFSALLAERPPDPLQVGAALFRSGRYVLALQALTAGEAIHADLPADHYLTKAMAFLRLGDLEGAKACIAEAGEDARQSARAYVLDLVDFAEGALTRSDVRERYGERHPIWRDLPGGAGATE